jgi:hypothetical protein
MDEPRGLGDARNQDPWATGLGVRVPLGEGAAMSGPLEDPVVRDARREAAAVAIIAVVATAYSLGYCALFGYGRTGEPITFVLGFPSWVFWGIVAPWGVCTLIAGWFSWRFMRDEDLGEGREDAGDA